MMEPNEWSERDFAEGEDITLNAFMRATPYDTIKAVMYEYMQFHRLKQVELWLAFLGNRDEQKRDRFHYEKLKGLMDYYSNHTINDVIDRAIERYKALIMSK